MKRIIPFAIIILFSSCYSAADKQTIAELKIQVAQLKEKVIQLEDSLALLKIQKHKPVVKSKSRNHPSAKSAVSYSAPLNDGNTKANPESTTKSYSTSSGSSSSSGTSSQCSGYTKKGKRCSRMVRGGGYCYQHR